MEPQLLSCGNVARLATLGAIVGFNGAAASQLRKLTSASTSAPRIRLQWSRSFSAAETRVNKGARRELWRFNGAAASQLRKLQ